ncbi:hypothetical protein BH10PSE17_BH10PSE17_11600 [soil metagenome]
MEAGGSNPLTPTRDIHPIRLLLILLSGIASFGRPSVASAQSFEQTCEQTLEPTTVVVSTERPSVVATVERPSVISLGARVGLKGDLRIAATLGLTATQPKAELQVDLHGLSDPAAGRVCVRPMVSLALTFAPIQVAIAREIDDRSCAFRHVYNHERQHVDVFIDGLPAAGETARTILQDRLGSTIYFADSYKRVRQQIQDAVTGASGDLMALATLAIDRANQALDDGSVAAAEPADCGAELAEVIVGAERARLRELESRNLRRAAGAVGNRP